MQAGGVALSAKFSANQISISVELLILPINVQGLLLLLLLNCVNLNKIRTGSHLLIPFRVLFSFD